MQEVYKITGGVPIRGEIRCYGAKNFATKAMVAALLGDSPSLLTNVPAIGDVDITLDMLVSIGTKVSYDRQANTLLIDPSSINTSEVNMPHSGSNRIPILLLSPLLHRFGKVAVPMMGGCNIGARKVDFHTAAIELFGGVVEENEDGFFAHRNTALQGTHIDLPYPSVGATETSLFLGVLAEGTTVITNAAIEPEIYELITMLRAMGAIIFTYPERKIVIQGVSKLHGTKMHILGDRIEGASWACLACASDGEIIVDGLRPNTLGNFLPHFQQVGGGFEMIDASKIRFFRRSPLKPIMLETDVYPGFSTDWQQPFAIMLTQAEGTSIIHETVYEKRFGYLEALTDLGAKTQLTTYCLGKTCRFENKGFEHSAIITGKTPLKAVESITVPDLRAGLAYVIAAALAEGTTLIKNIANIERGYGNISERCKNMSLNIEKISI